MHKKVEYLKSPAPFPCCLNGLEMQEQVFMCPVVDVYVAEFLLHASFQGNNYVS